MFKFIVLGVILILLALVVAEPLMQVGKRISNRFKGIADDLEDEDNG